MSAEQCWVRVIAPDGRVLEEGPAENAEVATEWRQMVRHRYPDRPLLVEEREHGAWVELMTIES